LTVLHCYAPYLIVFDYPSVLTVCTNAVYSVLEFPRTALLSQEGEKMDQYKYDPTPVFFEMNANATVSHMQTSQQASHSPDP
jgi:hypothetical protein